MNIFEYVSYKSFLQDYLEEARRPGLVSMLANSAGCDRTYIAQVLSGKAQLTPDQALGLTDAFGMSHAEADCFLLLVLKERATQSQAKEKLEKRLEDLRRDYLAVTGQIRSTEQVAELEDEKKIVYYSSWKYAAAHILVSIKTLQTVPKIAAELAISEREAASILETLTRFGLVNRIGDRYVHSGKNLHVAVDSPLNAINHANWRLQAVESVSQADSVHYTDVFSASAEDALTLKAMILKFITQFRKKVRASGAEEAFGLTVDFFGVGRGP